MTDVAIADAVSRVGDGPPELRRERGDQRRVHRHLWKAIRHPTHGRRTRTGSGQMVSPDLSQIH